MKRKINVSVFTVFLSAVFVGISVGNINTAKAGNLSPTSSPASSGFTLENIYQKLANGTDATEGNHDLTTSASPAGTFHTLKEIYEAIPTLVANTIKKGTTYLGITGTLTPDGGTAVTGDVFNGKTVHLTDDWNLDTGTLDLACNVSTFNGTSNLISNDYDGSGDGSNRWCIKDTGDAVASEILSSKIVWVDGEEITGTMTNVGSEDFTPTTSSQTISEGYHDGTGTVEGDSDLTAGNIKSGTEIFSVNGTYSGYPGTEWEANGSGDGSTELTQSECDDASDWEWFADGNGDGDTNDPEDGICIQTTTVTSGSWNGDDNASARDNSYIADYTCQGNFPNGTVATYSGIDSGGNDDTTWTNGKCALCQADCYDGKKDLPDQGGYDTPSEAIDGNGGPLTSDVLRNWKGTRLPSSDDFFGFCGYKDGGSDYETSCSSDTTIGNYGHMIGRTDECMDLTNTTWEWLSERHYYYSARLAGYYACSYFNSNNVYVDSRFRGVFRP